MQHISNYLPEIAARIERDRELKRDIEDAKQNLIHAQQDAIDALTWVDTMQHHLNVLTKQWHERN